MIHPYNVCEGEIQDDEGYDDGWEHWEGEPDQEEQQSLWILKDEEDNNL